MQQENSGKMVGRRKQQNGDRIRWRNSLGSNHYRRNSATGSDHRITAFIFLPFSGVLATGNDDFLTGS